MEKELIEKEMHLLEEKIHYEFTDITNLSKAMASIKLDVEGQGKNGSEYSNETLALVGDAVLKLSLADYLYKNMKLSTKGEITIEKEKLENNEVLHKIMIEEGFINSAYNEFHFYGEENVPEHEKVVCKKHDPYIEAIIGAIFYDSNFEATREWIISFLLPLLQKYKLVEEEK